MYEATSLASLPTSRAHRFEIRDFRLAAATVLTIGIFLLSVFDPMAAAASSLYVLVILLCAGLVTPGQLCAIGGACAALAVLAYLSRWPVDRTASVNLILALSLIGATSLRASLCARAEQDARESEAQTRSIFDNVASVLWVEDYSAVRRGLENLRRAGVEDLEAYMQRNPDFLARAIASVRPRDINARGLEMLHARSRDEFFQHHRRILFSAAEAFRTVLLALWRGETHHQAQASLIGVSGQPVEALVSVSFDLHRPSLDRVVVSFTDISGLLTAQRHASESQEGLAQAARLTTLAELSVSIAQEVNAPLGAILTNAQSAARFLRLSQPDLEGVRDAVERIVQDAVRAAGIVQHRRASRRREQVVQSIDLNELIEASLALLAPDLARLNARIDLDLARELPRLEGDVTALRQALLNLLLNAAQAGSGLEPAPSPIRVRTRDLGERLCLQVIDHGRGLPIGDAERIFEAFYSTTANGVGVGLTVTRSIIEAHGGAIVAGDTEGGGATFTIDLPTRCALTA